MGGLIPVILLYTVHAHTCRVMVVCSCPLKPCSCTNNLVLNSAQITKYGRMVVHQWVRMLPPLIELYCGKY